ncbi:MAG: 2TM domain-containing protein [Spirochaetales bacterium]|nr:2TM domain-containing protein [Spirochaetales bacterium]
MSDQKNEYQLSTVLFTNIHGFSRMMEKDEMATLDALKKYNDTIFNNVKKRGGKILKTIGDGVLALFPNNLNAVRAAIEIQNDLYHYNAGQPEERKVFVREGLHMGDIIMMENDAVGEVINIASRLQSIARPGGICISREVYNQVFNKIDFKVSEIGKVNLKNITKEIYAYEILTEFHSEVRSSTEQLLKDELSPGTGTQSGLKEESVLNRVFTDLRRANKKELQAMLNWPLQRLETALARLEQKNVISKIQQQDGNYSFGVEKYEDLKAKMKEQALTGYTGPGMPYPPGDPFEKKRRLRGFKKKLMEHGFQWIKQKILDARDKAMAGFRVHFFVYFVVNVFLAFINIFLTPQHPWVYYVLGGWGIGITANLVDVFNKRKEAKQLEQIDDMSEEQYLLLRKYQHNEQGLKSHLAVYVHVISFLFGINMITSPGFLWSFIVLGGWGIGMFAHWSSYLAAKSQLKRKLKTAGIDITDLKATLAAPGRASIAPSDSGPLQRAQAMKESILQEIKKDREHKSQWGEMEPLLNKFITQIEDLTRSRDEMDRILNTVSLDEINHELNTLKQKNAATDNVSLTREYERSIAQHENHKKTIEDLLNQREIINVRLKSSLTLLNQMKLDTARIKNLSQIGEPFSLKEIREKTTELSEYIDDVQEEMNNLDI